MWNLGVNCDLKSCHLCDTCIHDDDYADVNMEENKVKRTYCDGCPFISKLRVSTGTTCYYNLYCTKNQEYGTKKLIDISVPETKMTPAPCWCAHNKEVDGDVQTSAVSTVKKNWNTIEPTIDFKEIKEGDVFHVPPFDNHKRMDILITRKTEYSASYKILNDASQGFSINTIYPNTMIMRYLVKHKIQEIEVQQKN